MSLKNKIKKFSIFLVLKKEEIKMIENTIFSRIDTLQRNKVVEKTTDTLNIDKDIEDLYKIFKYFY